MATRRGDVSEGRHVLQLVRAQFERFLGTKQAERRREFEQMIKRLDAELSSLKPGEPLAESTLVMRWVAVWIAACADIESRGSVLGKEFTIPNFLSECGAREIVSALLDAAEALGRV